MNRIKLNSVFLGVVLTLSNALAGHAQTGPSSDPLPAIQTEEDTNFLTSTTYAGNPRVYYVAGDNLVQKMCRSGVWDGQGFSRTVKRRE